MYLLFPNFRYLNFFGIGNQNVIHLRFHPILIRNGRSSTQIITGRNVVFIDSDTIESGHCPKYVHLAAGVLNNLDVTKNVIVVVHLLQRYEINLGCSVNQTLGNSVEETVETSSIFDDTLKAAVIKSLHEIETSVVNQNDCVFVFVLMHVMTLKAYHVDGHALGQAAGVRRGGPLLQIRWHR